MSLLFWLLQALFAALLYSMYRLERQWFLIASWFPLEFGGYCVLVEIHKQKAWVLCELNT